MNTRPFDRVTLGLVQMSCAAERQFNLEKALVKIREAAAAGAQIVCLQELFESLYFCQTHEMRFFNWAEAVPGRVTDVLSRIAREHKIVIVASLFEKAQDRYFNTAAVLDADGRYLGKYRKVHVPDDPGNFYSEKFYFASGDLGFKVFDTRYARIGVQVCWDQWFPEGARSLALQGAEILFYPTAIGWPQRDDPELGRDEYEAWVTVQRGHAISNTVYVAAVNRVGPENQLTFWGGSFVADPLGRLLGQASQRQEQNLIVTVDLDRIDKLRHDWPFLTCRHPESYGL